MKGTKSKGKADSKLSVKKTAPAKRGKGAEKDPNKPKRPPSAFFVFMEEFREEYKKKHPGNKSVATIGKAGGEKWRSFSDAEKAPYVQKADKRKAEYEKTLKAYNKKQAEGTKADEEEESDRSKSEVNDDEDDDEGSDEEDDD
ncbi:High mobility group B protein 3-like protein [Drosera capensis]